jgi:hypothetical protein
MRIVDICGYCLQSVWTGRFGVGIALRRKVLIAAIVVGLCQTAVAAAANAPGMTIKFESHPKLYAKMLVYSEYHSSREYACLVSLWTRESHWNKKAASKYSTAYGIPQFLNETWGHYHFPTRPKSAIIQVNAGLRYIAKRYGSPCNAWAFWQRNEKRGNAWY